MPFPRPTLTLRTLAWLAAIIAVAVTGVRMAMPEAIDVEVALAGRGTLRVTLDEEGLTRMRRHTVVAAPVSGRLAEARVTAGDSVSAGASVAVLMPAPLDARTEAEARAAARAARALVSEADAGIRRAEIALGEARRERERLERLAAAGGVAPRDVEASVAAEGLRTRELEAARARDQAAREDAVRAEAALRGTGATVSGAIRLRAPMAGRVLRVFEEHDRVVPAGTPLLEIGDVGTLEVVIDVLSRDAASVTPGQAVLVRFTGGDSALATVTRVEPAAFTKVSPLGIEEQRVNVVARFLQPPVGLGDNYTVQASVILWEGSDVLSVPATALVPAGDGWGVFRYMDGRARHTPVILGRRGARNVEVREGLDVGDTLIVHPDSRVVEGARVRPKRPA